MSTRSLTPTVAAPVPAITPVRGTVLQRACDCGQHTVGGAECEECKKKKKTPLQRQDTASGGPSVAPPIVHDVLSSPGQALDGDTRAFFEPRLGHDFSQVRVHQDTKSAESAEAVNALAYTVGNNLVFGAGRYAPATSHGRRLLAHELTHVVQQQSHGASSIQYQLEIGAEGDHFEQEADRMAERVVDTADVDGGSGFSPSHARPTLQRATESPATTAQVQTSSSRMVRPLLVEDDVRDLKEGQMRKGEFLVKLQVSVCAAADEELKAVGRTTQACPYLARWMNHLSMKESSFVERALRKYAPEAAGAARADAYIPPVTARVRRGVARWAKTGEITEVPDELRGQLIAANVVGAIENAISGIGSAIGKAASAVAGGVKKAASTVSGLFAKERAGGLRGAGSEQEIRSHLGEGHPLEGGVRARMETAFGQDFSDVRIHADPHSFEQSNQLNARAFTVGRDIGFAAGEYQPGTLIGDALLAHELAHVLQQRNSAGGVIQKSEGVTNYNALEEDADMSAVGAVVRLWTGTQPGFGETKKRSLPSLRSGLRLQRCGGSHPELQMVSGRHVGDIAGSVNNKKEEVLAAMDRLHILWAMPNPDYNVEYPAVSKLPPNSIVPTDAIPKTIAAIGRLGDTTLSPLVANPVLGITLAGTVGKGGFNKKEDILVLQDSLRGEFILPKNEYDTEHAAVSALATPTVADNVIPKTIAAIARMKREFVAGMIRRDVFAGTHAVTETQHRNIEGKLNPQLTVVAPPPPPAGGPPPPPPVIHEPDPMTDTGPGGAFEKEMFKMFKDNLAAWGGEFRAKKAEKGQPAFPIASANNIARAAQGEVERYYAPYIRTATRAPGEKYHVSEYSLTEKLGDESTRPITPGDRKGWMDYFMTLRFPNCRKAPCGQKILDDHKYLGSRDNAERKRVRDLYLADPANLIDLDDTIHGWPAEAGTGTVFIQPYQHVKGDEGRRNRWKLFQTLIHEMMHIVSHPNFATAANVIGGSGRKILVEGFAEVFRREIWAEGGALKARLPGPEMAGVREQVEGASYDYNAALVPEPSYYEQITQATDIDKEVGRPNTKAAYFTGHVELIGLGTGTRTEHGLLAGVGMYEPSDDPDAQVIVSVAGDTYANVLARTGASPGSLVDDATAAVLPPGAPIAPGARIRIPGIRWVRAIAHDTLGTVAKQHHVPVEDLARANGFPPAAPPATPFVVGTRVLVPIHKNFP